MLQHSQNRICPLCSGPGRFFYADEGRDWQYHKCGNCELIWMDSKDWPSKEAERAHYDPFFNPDESVFEKKYDFITCSETAEHFRDPLKEFKRLATLLEPGGVLGVMTYMQDSKTAFANWHYRHDPTHVVFYSEKTFGLLVDRSTFSQCDHPAKNVALLTR